MLHPNIMCKYVERNSQIINLYVARSLTLYNFFFLSRFFSDYVLYRSNQCWNSYWLRYDHMRAKKKRIRFFFTRNEKAVIHNHNSARFRFVWEGGGSVWSNWRRNEEILDIQSIRIVHVVYMCVYQRLKTQCSKMVVIWNYWYISAFGFLLTRAQIPFLSSFCRFFLSAGWERKYNKKKHSSKIEI